MSDGYRKYLKNIKIKKVMIVVCQILILLVLLIGWQYLADHNYINTFISSSPKLVWETIVNLYNSNDLFTKFAYIGGIYALIRANSFVREFIGGVSTNISQSVNSFVNFTK